MSNCFVSMAYYNHKVCSVDLMLTLR